SVKPLFWLMNLVFSSNPPITGIESAEFVEASLRHFPKGTLLVWDRAPIHRGASVRKLLRKTKRIHIEHFPSYSPQINPQEGVWSQTKYHELANFCPNYLDQLKPKAVSCLGKIKKNPRLFRSFFHACDPPLKI
ncbi:MAG: transposase, partial [Planctomycetota bacterium]|nr:transposase [Planctomycetota bacterium]